MGILWLNAAICFGIDPRFAGRRADRARSIDIGAYWNGNEGIVFTGYKWFALNRFSIEWILQELGFCFEISYHESTSICPSKYHSQFSEADPPASMCDSRQSPNKLAVIPRSFRFCAFCKHFVDIKSWIPVLKIRVPLNTRSSSSWINILRSFKSKLSDNILTAKQRMIGVRLCRSSGTAVWCLTFETNCNFHTQLAPCIAFITKLWN